MPEPLPDWVGQFLNRRTAVEHQLREWIKRAEATTMKTITISAHDLRILADRLSIPDEHR